MTSRSKSVLKPLVRLKVILPVRPSQWACREKRGDVQLPAVCLRSDDTPCSCTAPPAPSCLLRLWGCICNRGKAITWSLQIFRAAIRYNVAWKWLRAEKAPRIIRDSGARLVWVSGCHRSGSYSFNNSQLCWKAFVTLLWLVFLTETIHSAWIIRSSSYWACVCGGPSSYSTLINSY